MVSNASPRCRCSAHCSQWCGCRRWGWSTHRSQSTIDQQNAAPEKTTHSFTVLLFYFSKRQIFFQFVKCDSQSRVSPRDADKRGLDVFTTTGEFPEFPGENSRRWHLVVPAGNRTLVHSLASEWMTWIMWNFSFRESGDSIREMEHDHIWGVSEKRRHAVRFNALPQLEDDGRRSTIDTRWKLELLLTLIHGDFSVNSLWLMLLRRHIIWSGGQITQNTHTKGQPPCFPPQSAPETWTREQQNVISPAETEAGVKVTGHRPLVCTTAE